ncbi:MAG: antitoxin Xre/MbcA/ParS toxin-binding domain-containing protein [Noviherbaspirillum sp.]
MTPPVPKTGRSAKERVPRIIKPSAPASDFFEGNVSDVIRIMRRGMSAQVVPDVAARLGISQDKLFERLRLPKSTMKSRIGNKQPLSATEQDRMYRADRVWNRALAVLEDENAARSWITRDNRSLGGESPLALLDTEAGYELVLDTLGRIEYGVVA